MIVSGSVTGPVQVPLCPPGMGLVAAVDVEWSKNYRVRGGNVPFCYSVAWLRLPLSGPGTAVDMVRFGYKTA